MTKTKSTKHALITSVMAMFLCFTMLLGSTFAWFTDSVTSSGNIIKAGTLKVGMYYAEGNAAVPTTEEGWSNASEGAIFNYDKWEPGYVEAKHIKIVNEGNLAFKYKLLISPNGEVSELADVIDVYFVDPAKQIATRDELADIKPVGTLREFIEDKDGAVYGALLPAGATVNDANYEKAGEAVATIAFKMRTEAGNEYKGMSIGTDFSIQILATQYNYEGDSFDNQYDANLDAMTNGISCTLDDGSSAFYYGEDSGYYGRVRLTELPENIGSEYVVPAEVNDLGSALTNVTLDKLTIPAGVDYAYKSLEGATIDEVVIEEGATTIPDRMFYKTKVASVVIPSSVTVIEQNAFAQAAVVEELVIPASVTTVEEAAFQHMTNLTTVTFEGNTAIQGYAFRGCSALRTVYLKGDDVTFVPSTLNNINSCWFCNGESNNPGTSTITFYVQNATMATRVHSMMGADVTTITIVVDGATYITNQEALTAAIDGGVNEILLAAGEYELTKARVGVTIKGADEETVLVNASVPIYGFNGKIPVRMHFENLTFTNTMSTFQDTATAEDGGGSCTFTNVTFAAGFRHGYGSAVVFTDCTFGSNSEGYALHFEGESSGAGLIKLTGCEFKGGKVHLGGPRTYTFTGCDFAAGTDFQVWSGITIDGCTVDGAAITSDNIVTAFPNLGMNYVTIK